MQILAQQPTFGTKKEFKRLFKVCAYSGEAFEPHDTKTIEHIIPVIRGGDKYSYANRIIVKRSINSERSDTFLKEYMAKYPQVRENIRATVKSLEGKIIDGLNWAEEVKKTFFQEIGEDIFK